MARISINADEIRDWPSFHDLFATNCGFPSFYGRNMDAWIDCMSYLDAPDDGMTTVHVQHGEVLVLDLGKLGDFPERCPEIFRSLVDCTAIVNYRRLINGDPAILTLAYSN